MKWLKELLYGPQAESVFAEQISAPVKEKKPTRAEIDAAWAEADAAEKEYDKACSDAFESYQPTGPAFKIVQTNDGHYEIHRREVVAANDPYKTGLVYFDLSSYARAVMPSQYRSAEGIRERPTLPTEYYQAVRNDKAPIVTKRYSSSYSYGYDNASVTGYAPLIFNVFADAEAYLKRMTAKRPKEVGYDYPPLKKRDPA